MDTNPYAAPREMASAPPPTEPEAIRRDHLKHEASVKAVGSLYIIEGILLLLGAAIALAGWETLGGAKGWVLPIAGALGAGGILCLGVASGLRKLRLAGWFAASVISSVAFVLAVIQVTERIVPLPAGIAALATQGYILVILFSPKSTLVCGSRYRKIIAATPHIKSRTPTVIWIVLGLFLLVLIVWSAIDR